MLLTDTSEFSLDASLMGSNDLSWHSRLLHLDLLRVSLFVVQLGLQTDQLLGLVGALVSLAALLLPFLFMVVKAIAVPLAM